jgi:protein phosphatase 2C
MVMASAGVNVPGGGGDGNPAAAAASPTAAECRLRRRRRLSPPRASAAASGSSDAGAGSSSSRRRAAPPASSSDADTVDEGDTEEEAEEGRELPPVAPAAAAPGPARQEQQPSAAAEAWPLAFGSMELAGRMREMEDTISLHPGFFTWVDGTPMHFFAVFDGHGGPHVSQPQNLASERGGLPPARQIDLLPALLLASLPATASLVSSLITLVAIYIWL